MAVTDKGLIEKTGGGGGGSGSCNCTCTGDYNPVSVGTDITGMSLCDVLSSSSPPVAHINSASPSCGYREINDTLTNPTIDYSATRGTNGADLGRIEVSRNGALIHTESPASYGTTYSFTDTYTTDTADTTYEVRAIDVNGKSNSTTCSYLFTLPWYATTVDITTLTKQPLVSLTSNYFQGTLVAETTTDKHKADFVNDGAYVITLTGVQFYDTTAGAWKWFGDDKAVSLTYWDKTTVSHTVQGTTYNYDRYTYNGVKVGEQQIRFWRV